MGTYYYNKEKYSKKKTTYTNLNNIDIIFESYNRSYVLQTPHANLLYFSEQQYQELLTYPGNDIVIKTINYINDKDLHFMYDDIKLSIKNKDN